MEEKSKIIVKGGDGNDVALIPAYRYGESGPECIGYTVEEGKEAHFSGITKVADQYMDDNGSIQNMPYFQSNKYETDAITTGEVTICADVGENERKYLNFNSESEEFLKIYGTIPRDNLYDQQENIYFNDLPKDIMEQIEKEIIEDTYLVGEPDGIKEKTYGHTKDEIEGILRVVRSSNYKTIKLQPTYHLIVYNTSFDPKINEELFTTYFRSFCKDCTREDVLNEAKTYFIEFMETHASQLVKAFGGEDGLVAFIKKYGNSINEKEINSIIPKSKKSYTSSGIAEGISPTNSDINGIIEETVPNKIYDTHQRNTDENGNGEIIE